MRPRTLVRPSELLTYILSIIAAIWAAIKTASWRLPLLVFFPAPLYTVWRTINDRKACAKCLSYNIEELQ